MRAYCTQNGRPIETTSTAKADSSRLEAFIAACATPSRSKTIRIAGNVSCMSGYSHDHRVHPSSCVSRNQPESDAAKADSERDAQPIEDRRQEIAPLVVGSQQELRVSARLKDSDLLASFLSSKVTVAAGAVTIILFVGQRYADERQRLEQSGQRTVATQGRVYAHRHPRGERQDRRDERELERGGHARADQIGDRLLELVGHAEVEPSRVMRKRAACTITGWSRPS